ISTYVFHASTSPEIYTLSLHDALPLSDDIVTHRQLMGIPLQPCDLDFTTCLYRYEKPASPHLAVKLANAVLDLKIITKSTQQLRSEEHTSELQSRENLVCRLLLEKKKK